VILGSELSFEEIPLAPVEPVLPSLQPQGAGEPSYKAGIAPNEPAQMQIYQIAPSTRLNPPLPSAIHPLLPLPGKRQVRELRLDLRTLDAAALFALETWRRQALGLEKMKMKTPDYIAYREPSPSTPPPSEPLHSDKRIPKRRETLSGRAPGHEKTNLEVSKTIGNTDPSPLSTSPNANVDGTRSKRHRRLPTRLRPDFETDAPPRQTKPLKEAALRNVKVSEGKKLLEALHENGLGDEIGKEMVADDWRITDDTILHALDELVRHYEMEDGYAVFQAEAIEMDTTLAQILEARPSIPSGSPWSAASPSVDAIVMEYVFGEQEERDPGYTPRWERSSAGGEGSTRKKKRPKKDFDSWNPNQTLASDVSPGIFFSRRVRKQSLSILKSQLPFSPNDQYVSPRRKRGRPSLSRPKTLRFVMDCVEIPTSRRKKVQSRISGQSEKKIYIAEDSFEEMLRTGAGVAEDGSEDEWGFCRIFS